jgi:very-short-patch-repair endonuclease
VSENQEPLPPSERVLTSAAKRRVIEQIDIWRKELINLARTNRLLYFRHTKSSTLEIVREPDQVSQVVERLIAGGAWRFHFPAEPAEPQETDEAQEADDEQLFADEVAQVPEPDELITTKAEARTLQNALRLLDRRATQEFMDKGLWILYLAAGILHWSDPDTSEPAESPLVLIPVQLYRENPREPYELRRAEEDVVINPALGVKLAEFGIDLPAIEDDEFDIEAVLAEVEQAIGSQPGWEVRRRLVISPFSFHKEVMFRDLVKNEEEIADHTLVQALSLGAEEGSELDFDPVAEEDLDEEEPPEEVDMILDADATQRQCIAAAGSGRSFVMDGPPGTGKSQTIANVIAELLAKGKTVLFVSEKAAALEVVQKRLRAAGLGDYTLELHSHKATRKEVAQQLGASLELHPAAPPAMSQTALSKLVRRREELSERAKAMNEIRLPLGRSLHQAIGRIAQLQHLPQAPPPPEIGSELSAEQLSQTLIAAGEIARAWGPVARGDEFLWRELKDVRLDAARQQRTAEQVNAATSRLHEVSQLAADAAEALLLPVPQEFGSAETLVRVLKQIEARHEVPQAWLTTVAFREVEERWKEREKLASTYEETERTLIDIVGERWRDVDPAATGKLNEATDALRGLSLAFEIPDDLPVSELRPLQQFVANSVAVIESTQADARAIADSFGLPTRMTLGRAVELAELALLAGESARPEAGWVNPAVVEAVEQAAASLQPLCAAFGERREKLGRVFTDDVLTLDLESLCQRFETVHTGLGKLKGAYRADKKTIAASTRWGKATKETIALLPQVLEWQELDRRLEVAERQHAHALGDHYYHRTDSDFDSITRALENVRRALEIAGRHLNAEAMQRQLARGGAPDPELLPTAQRLKETIEPWRQQASSVLGSFADQLTSAELETAAAWCRDASDALGPVADVAIVLPQLSGRPLTFSQAWRALDARTGAALIEATVSEAFDADRSLLGNLYDGLQTNWEALRAAVEWTSEFRALVGEAISSGAAQRIQTIELNWSELDDALAGWYRARDVVLDDFAQERCDELRSDLDTTFADAEQLLASLEATLGDIDEWVEHQSALEQLRRLNVAEVISFCASIRVASDDVSRIVERACLERWADAVIGEDMARLKQLRADQLDPIVDEFRQLDVELIDHVGGRVISACNLRRPRTTIGAAGTIKREAEKQRKHMPVRKLLEEAGEVAQALKPCFMMSPLTVSQFLPTSLKFDAVVFDEASQVRPSDAINCVYRGSQLIVAGDDKQLPPTSFFEAILMDAGDEWEEEQFDEFESILQLSKGSGGLRELPLKWHYRSQHEDLITYSNQSFYDGRLITFPGAAHEADDLGVKFFHVEDGVYRRGTSRDNPREAEVVADRVMQWARTHLENPDREFTVGVVAFSESQATAIEVALDKRRQGAPELDAFFAEDRLDGFFVKNLENVQGDERDVMIFSVGYGRDENGKLTMNFGPLNRDGGQRRLNVAITRARRRVEVIASITGTEQEFNAQIKEGARHLQRYLDYAARGPLALALDLGESGLDAESPFEEEVIRTIRSWGYEVQPQVGTAGYRVDIGVKHPDKSGFFALGVECDGWMYHSSKVARDRDRLRQEVLERLGWRIYRIWGTAWYRNRSEQEQRLRAAIESAINGGGVGRPPRTRKLETPAWDNNASFQAVALNEAPSWTVQYRVADPKRPSRRGLDMHLPESQTDFRRMIVEVVEVEGPVRDALVLRRVREAWGVGRAGHRIREAFDRAVAALARRGDIKRVERRFLALNEDQLAAVRVPGSDATARRDVDEVPPAELKLAVKHLVRDARRVSRDELTFEVARLFGWNRRGPDIAAALEGAVDALVRDRMIGEDDDYLKAL